MSLGVDPSGVGGGGGRYMATAGRDGVVKVWDCRNWKGAVRTWGVRGGGAGGVGETEVGWSQRGALAVASGGTVNVRFDTIGFLAAIISCVDCVFVLICCATTGLHNPLSAYTASSAKPTTPLSHPSHPSPSAALSSVLSIPRYIDNRTCERVIEYFGARKWRAEL